MSRFLIAVLFAGLSLSLPAFADNTCPDDGFNPSAGVSDPDTGRHNGSVDNPSYGDDSSIDNPSSGNGTSSDDPSYGGGSSIDNPSYGGGANNGGI